MGGGVGVAAGGVGDGGEDARVPRTESRPPWWLSSRARVGVGTGPVGEFVFDPEFQVAAQAGVDGQLAAVAALARANNDEPSAGR